jgi:lysophospholipase
MDLVSTPDNTIPDGATSGVVKTRDGVSLRYASWKTDQPRKGAVCLCQGRTEYIEKYFEVVRELRARGFDVVTFDWRGQGLSDRALPDRRKGHVESFDQFDIDLQTVIDQVLKQTCSPPYIGLAHSMGGAILLRFVSNNEHPFDRIVLTSPMIGLVPAIFSSPFALFVARGARSLGFGTRYVPNGSDKTMDKESFEGNVYTSDPKRFARITGVLTAYPDLGIGSPTMGWMAAANEAMAEFRKAVYASPIHSRTLIVAAGGDRIASTPVSKALAERSGKITHIVVDKSEHELLVEQDRYRAQFWSAFDSFVR